MKALIAVSFLLLVLGCLSASQEQTKPAANQLEPANELAPQNISVENITYCKHEHTAEEWEQIKGSEYFWRGECPP